VEFTVSLDTILDQQLLQRIREVGFSRIPVTISDNKHFIVGILLTKSLIGINVSKEKTLRTLY